MRQYLCPVSLPYVLLWRLPLCLNLLLISKLLQSKNLLGSWVKFTWLQQITGAFICLFVYLLSIICRVFFFFLAFSCLGLFKSVQIVGNASDTHRRLEQSTTGYPAHVGWTIGVVRAISWYKEPWFDKFWTPGSAGGTRQGTFPRVAQSMS